MKKLLTLLSVVALAIACKKDDGPDVGTHPVKPSAEVRAFFDEHLEDFSGTILDKDGIEPRADGCVMINSVEELPELEYTLPDFDFAKHTLVVGRRGAPYGGYELLGQGVDVEFEAIYLNLWVQEGKGISPTIYIPGGFLFWGVYSKLPQKRVVPILIINN